MNVNPIQLINMIRNGQNPQQLIMNIFKQNNNNPILNNAMNLAHNGDTSALEMIARNLAQQRGLDFDTEFAKFKNYLNQ
jgi:hypothetical protein